MAIIRLKGLLVSVLLVLFFTTIPMATLVSVTTLILTGTHLSSFAIFTLLLGFATLRLTFCYSLSLCMQVAADGKVAIDRMQKFLMENLTKLEGNGVSITQDQHLNDNRSVQNCKGEKKTKTTVQLVSYKYIQSDEYLSGTQSVASTSSSEALKELSTPRLLSTNSIIEEPYVSISEASCSWNQDILSNTLSNITFDVYNGKLLAITGAVGSGKSSLLTAILGELPLYRGSVSYHGKIAYVPQIPWVFSGTIRENILFGLPFNEERFQQVVQICELTKDLTNFTNGDLTEIGQRGVTLSGGQKARVGLARAVYSEADIYLLDDPLSAVDTKVGRRLFESCILGHLSGRIRLLVTHQLQYLKDVDRAVVMENGSIIHHGKYTEILDLGAVRGVAGLPEHYEDRTVLPHSISLDDAKGTNEELGGLSISSINECDMLENAQHQTFHLTLAEPIKGEKKNVETWQQVSSGSTVSRPKGFPEGKLNEAFEDDNEEYECNLHEKERLDHKLPKPFDNGPCVIVNECNNKGIAKNVLNEPPVSFVGGPPPGEDNEAFVDDHLAPPPQNEGVGVNVSDEAILQTTSPLVLTNMCDVSEADAEEPSFLDLKEDEETKNAGTVTFRLYWDYFKEGLSVSRIMLLAVALIFAQGKSNSVNDLKLLLFVPISETYMHATCISLQRSNM